MINNFIFSVLAKIVNADRIGGWVRAGVAIAFGFLAAKLPVLVPFLTPELAQAVQLALSGLAIMIWSSVAKATTAPTETQVVAVIAQAADQGVVPVATAAAVKADPTIAMPDKAVGTL